MEDTLSIRPSVCFEVQKIIGVSIGNGNLRNYQVQWAPTWVSGFHLVGCEHLIDEFIQQKSEKDQFVDDSITTSGVTDTDDSHNDPREDVLRDDDVPEFISGHQSQEEIHERPSMVANNDCNSRSYSNTSNDNGNVIVNLKFVKIENWSDNEDSKEDNDTSKPIVHNNPRIDNKDVTNSNADLEGDRKLLTAYRGKSYIFDSGNEIQNNSMVNARKEIMLIEDSQSDQSSLNYYCDSTVHSSDKLNKYIESRKTISKKENPHLYIGHTGEKPYKCGDCNAAFSRKHVLATHLRLHSGEKPFRCSECNKTFAQKGNLIKHFRLHTGEKPFKCKYCSKSFSDGSNLRKHMKVHDGEKS